MSKPSCEAKSTWNDQSVPPASAGRGRTRFVLPSPSAGQPLGVLRVRVVLADTDGAPTPAPRYALLVSDNPPSAAPRRIITGLDGTVEVKLRPGNYTIESDKPLAFRGRRYEWLQTVTSRPARRGPRV